MGYKRANRAVEAAAFIGLFMFLLAWASPAFAVDGQIESISAYRTSDGSSWEWIDVYNGGYVNEQVDHYPGTSVRIRIKRKSDRGTPDFTFVLRTGDFTTRTNTLSATPTYTTFNDCADGNAYAKVHNSQRWFSIRSVSPPDKARVFGTVFNAVTSQGVSGAQVRIYNGGYIKKRATSASDGSFEFLNIPVEPTNYDIFTEADGYTGAWSGQFQVTAPETGPQHVYLLPAQLIYDLKPISVSHILDPAGDNVEVSVEVQNTGSTDRKLSFSIGVYASDNRNTFVTGEPNKFGSFPTDSAGIPVGQSRTFSHTFSVTTLEYGSLEPEESYYAKVEVDESRVWDPDAHGDNIRASAGRFTVAPPPTPDECYPGILKIEGDITGQCSDPTYTAAPGAHINDFVYIPDAMATVYASGPPRIEWTGNGFQLDPAPVSVLRNVFVTTNPLSVSVNTSTGVINDMTDRTLEIADGFYVHVESFELEPYASGRQVHTDLRFALPLNQAARDFARLWGTDVFEPERPGWTYVTADTSISDTRFRTDLQLSNDSIVGSLKASAGADIDFDKKEITFTNGSLSFEILDAVEVGAPVKLLELKLTNWFYYDTIHVEAEVPIPIEPISGTGINRLAVGVAGLSDPLTPFELRGGIGINVGKYGIDWHGVGLSFTLLQFDVDGRLIPSRLELHLGEGDDLLTAKLCGLTTPVPGFEFDGFPLFDGELNYYFLDGRADGYMEVHLGVPVLPMFAFDGEGCFEIDVLNSHLLARLEGKMIIPAFWSIVPFVDGEPAELGGAVAQAVMNDEDKAFRCFAYTRWFGGNGYGVTVPFDGSEPKHGVNLNKDILGQKQSGEKSEPVDIEIPSGLTNAIVRVTWAEGDLDATLTAPDLTVYDELSAAITESNGGPVFYSKKEGVEPNPNEEGALVNELCFYLVPEDPADDVAPGIYVLSVEDSLVVDDYEIQLWTPNTPPAITLIERATDPGDPTAVNIEWLAEDPDDDASILLYYDTNQEGYDGQLITYFSDGEESGPDPISEDTGPNTYVWDTTGLPTGQYYVYASTCPSRRSRRNWCCLTRATPGRSPSRRKAATRRCPISG